MIINIEGTDGSGKQTQTELLYNYLLNKGYKCLKLSFPNYDNAGCAPVKMYLNKEFGEDVNCLSPYQVNSFFAVDRLTTLAKIDLTQYDYVLFDRYVPASLIHQSSTLTNYADIDKFVDYVNQFEYEVLRLPKPDIVLFLDVPVETSLNLAKSRAEYKSGLKKDIFEEDEVRMRSAYEHAKYLSKKCGWTEIECVDGNLKSIDEIHNLILTKLNIK